jgi:putative flippase GtrA
MPQILLARLASTNKKDIVQFARCILIGLISNCVAFTFFLFLTYKGMEHKIAMSILYFLNLSIGFWGNFNWVFSTNNSIWTVGKKYLFAHLLGYSMNYLILFVFVDQLGYSHQWVQLGAIAVIAFFFLIIFKHFVFKENYGT